MTDRRKENHHMNQWRRQVQLGGASSQSTRGDRQTAGPTGLLDHWTNRTNWINGPTGPTEPTGPSNHWANWKVRPTRPPDKQTQVQESKPKRIQNKNKKTNKTFKNCTSIKKLQTLINYITDTETLHKVLKEVRNPSGY